MNRRSSVRISRLAAVALLAGMGALAWAQPSYKVRPVPLSVDPHNTTAETYSNAVNRTGMVAANFYQQLGGQAPYRCSKTSCVLIPPLGDTHHGGAWAAAINDAGLVVGVSPYLFFSRAFLFDGTSSQNLGAFNEGSCGGCDLSSVARGINNVGQVVGEGETDAGSYRAFIWQAGSMQKLGTLGGTESSATAINDDGVAVGQATRADGRWHAFMTGKAKLRDLGTLGGSQSQATAVNSARQVVGCSTLAGDTQTVAFLYAQGVMTPLPTLGGSQACATGINQGGRVVGNSTLAGDIESRGFHYDGTAVVDLNDTLSQSDRDAWLITAANGIGKKGHIAAVGFDRANGTVRAVLLVPVLAAPAR
jgi:probable HAF family extracellular repeat protein